MIKKKKVFKPWEDLEEYFKPDVLLKDIELFKFATNNAINTLTTVNSQGIDISKVVNTIIENHKDVFIYDKNKIKIALIYRKIIEKRLEEEFYK